MSTLLLTDECMLDHEHGPGHPERPERLRAILDAVDGSSFRALSRRSPRAATQEEVQRVHDRAYVARIDALRGRTAQLDSDTAVSPGSVEAAYRAAGAALEAVEVVMNNEAPAAFALVRPPGHHAERDRAMGFCLFNNIAVAAEHARAVLGCERVMIIDWDVHHGNGTQAAFYERDDVLFFSSHRAPFYPGTGSATETGRGRGRGFTVNEPLRAGVGDETVVPLYDARLHVLAADFRPDLLLVSAGFDAHRDDPLGGLRMTEAGFGALCHCVRELAERHAGGRMALVLEGGYSLSALAGSVMACLEVLAGGDRPDIEG